MEHLNTGGGSFRYWTDKPEGGAIMVFGVNVSGGIASPPHGELDVWVRTDALAEASGIADDEIRQRISASFPNFSKSFMDFIIRLKTTVEIEKLVSLLRTFGPQP